MSQNIDFNYIYTCSFPDMKWPTANLGNPNVFVRGIGGAAVFRSSSLQKVLVAAERCTASHGGPGMFPARGRAGQPFPAPALM